MTQKLSGYSPGNRPARRTPYAASAALAVATLAVATLVLASCSGGATHRPGTSATGGAGSTSGPTSSPPVASPTASHVVLPPGVLAEIPVDAGTAPVAMTQAFGSLWINTHRGGKVYRLDPQTNKIIVTLPVDDCCSPPVAIGGHLVAGDQIIDPTTNRVVGSVSTNPFVSVGGTPWGVGVGTLAALDPQTLRPVRTIKVNANARGVSDPDTYVTYGDGSFWVTVAGDETQTFGGVVVEVDRHTGRVLHTYRTPDPGGDADIQFLDHAVWLKGDDSGSLVRLDARTGATHVYTLPGWQALTSYFPQTIAIGDGDLWIRNSTRTVVRFRPTTGRVVGTYPASPSANGGYVSIAFGSLWIANFDNDTIWRVRITA